MVEALSAALCVALAVVVAPGRERPAVGSAPGPRSAGGALEGRGTGSHGGPRPVNRESAGRRRADQAGPSQDDVASALVLLALAYRSGLPTSQVLDAVASVLDQGLRAGDEDCVSRDLRQVATALHWGASDAEAWGSVGEVWSGAARAVAIAHRAGLPPGPLLLSAADELRRGAVEGLELAAARVGVRLVAPLGLVLLPAFCLTTVVPLVVALGRQMLAG